jgi:hypothetical protein
MTAARALPALLALVTLAVGCAPGTLGPETRLYAVGSTLELRVVDALEDVVLVSSDSTLISITPDRDAFRVDAVAEGEATIRAITVGDPSLVLGEWLVEVVAPTEAEILPVEETSLDTEQSMVAVVGRELDVLLVLRADGSELVGRGDVSIVASHGLVLEGEVGTHQVLLSAGVSHVDLEARSSSGEFLGSRGIDVVAPL